MTVGILGSGFGLYGYLPALASMGERVVMPERYRDKLRSRADVTELESYVTWVADDEAVFDSSSTLVVSRRPTDQVLNVLTALERGNIQRFLLEKPLGPDPASAVSLLDALERDRKVVRLGFVLPYTPWMLELSEWMAGVDDDAALVINWRFRAHHYVFASDTWKRRPSQGGGALRFYGIHLIALLAQLGYANVSSSSLLCSSDDEAEAWQSTFTGAGRPTCHLRVDSDSVDTIFELSGRSSHSSRHIVLRDPFDQVPVYKKLDRRVDALVRLCSSLLAGDTALPTWYRTSLSLWALAESQARECSLCLRS